MTNVEQRTLDEEERQHSYTSSTIPWYVRMIWLLFWIFAIYYAVTYLLPALQTEMVNPP